MQSRRLSTTLGRCFPVDSTHPCRSVTAEDSLGPDFRLLGRERSENVQHQPTGRGGEVEPVRPI
jgi:hypothetical protein